MAFTRLKELLIIRGMTQKELAMLTNISPQHISNMANGTRKITEEAARRITEHFPDVFPEWLLGSVDYMTQEEIEKHEEQQRKEEEQQRKEEERKRERKEKGFFSFVCGVTTKEGYSLSEQPERDNGHITALDAENKPIGTIELSYYDALRAEAEHYIKFLVSELIHEHLRPIDGAGKEEK
jgi:transcriptional regulator with XRE-family HTH domain